MIKHIDKKVTSLFTSISKSEKHIFLLILFLMIKHFFLIFYWLTNVHVLIQFLSKGRYLPVSLLALYSTLIEYICVYCQESKLELISKAKQLVKEVSHKKIRIVLQKNVWLQMIKSFLIFIWFN